MKTRRLPIAEKAVTAPPRGSKLRLAAIGAAIFLLAGMLLGGWILLRSRVDLEAAWAAYANQRDPGKLEILYPPNEAVFPPEIVPPTFRWQDRQASNDAWLIAVEFAAPQPPLRFLARQSQWTPDASDWEEIKQRSVEQPAEFAVQGFRKAAPGKILSGARIRIQTSRDPVGAPIFYREVNLPFLEAVKDPTRIRWRFGSIDEPDPPPIVLENLPVCGNCHSFSRDGSLLGMDVDYANDKGSYILTPVAKDMALSTRDIISWGDYRRDDNQLTFGFLSQVSPDGKRVISTVKDKSVFVAQPDLAFSQLFFPIQGILVVYDRERKTFQALPGADDPEFVQSNPAWSPDGKTIVFARARSYRLRDASAQGKVLISPEECSEFTREGKPFAYDLYRIPYQDGRGGPPEPLRGASGNGKSNYFPRYSPDGRWIVFCQAKNYMLLQPDSELYIIPAEGGEPRRLRGNTSRMNSWHSWSPNSRWLVFSSKAHSDYTQLFLTHIDEAGNSTPPVVLSHFTAPDRAANIPEFVPAPADAIASIRQEFLNDLSLARAAYVLEKAGEVDAAIEKYNQALEVNPKNVHAHQRLGFLLVNRKREIEPGLAHTREALRLDPRDGCAHFDLGMALFYLRRIDEATSHLTEAIRLMPEGFTGDYPPDYMNLSLGVAFLCVGRYAEAAVPLQKAVALSPRNASAHYHWAIALAGQEQLEASVGRYRQAVALDPQVDLSPELHDLLATQLASQGRYEEALSSARKAHELAVRTGRDDLAHALSQRIAAYQRHVH